MSRAAENLRIYIHSLEIRRAEVRDLEAAITKNSAGMLSKLMDEISGELDDISCRLGRAKNELWEEEGRIGRAEKIADAAFARNL